MRTKYSSRRLWALPVLLLAGVWGCGCVGAAEPPTVGEIQFSPTDTPFTTDTVTLSVTASSPAGLALTYTWDFGDGSAGVKTTTGSVNHVYATAGLYIAYVDVTEQGNPTPVSDNQWVEVIDPPAASDAVGICASDPPVVNPDTGLSVSVLADQGGVIQFGIDDSNVRQLTGRSLVTDWGDSDVNPNSRTASSSQPRHDYSTQGVYVATVTLDDTASGSPLAKVRKTVVKSAEEVGAAATIKAAPALEKRKLIVSKLQGKVNFKDLSKTDMVNLSFLFELPEGLDRLLSHDFTISAGNVVEKVSVDPKGKGVGVKFKKVKVKFPRLDKGVTLTPAGLMATVTVQLASTDLTGAGFDTEGITVVPKTVNPKIQVAMLMEGVGYTQQSEVELKVSTKLDKGTFKLPSR